MDTVKRQITGGGQQPRGELKDRLFVLLNVVVVDQLP